MTQAIHDAQQLLRGGQGPTGRERDCERHNNTRLVSRRLSAHTNTLSDTPHPSSPRFLTALGARCLSPLVMLQGRSIGQMSINGPHLKCLSFRTPTVCYKRRGAVRVSDGYWFTEVHDIGGTFPFQPRTAVIRVPLQLVCSLVCIRGN